MKRAIYSTLAFAAIVSAASVPAARAQCNIDTTTRTGEATYYTFADGTGNCMYDASPGDLMLGAMNDPGLRQLRGLRRVHRADGTRRIRENPDRRPLSGVPLRRRRPEPRGLQAPHRRRGHDLGRGLTRPPAAVGTPGMETLLGPARSGPEVPMQHQLSIRTEPFPRVERHDRVQVDRTDPLFTKVIAHYGFMETPNVPKIFETCKRKDLSVEVSNASFFLSRRTLRLAAQSEMPRWQQRLILTLSRFAEDSTVYFRIPMDRAVEVGTQVAI